MYFRGCCITIVFSYYINVALSGYFIENATSGCPSVTLATPNITYTEHGPVIEDNVSIQEGIEVAVGYITTYAAFQNIGCARVDDLPGEAAQHRTYPDPGQCRSACETQYFGIYRSWCYCLADGVGYNQEHCNEPCSNPQGSVCGRLRRGGAKYASVYEYLPFDDNTNENGRYCRMYSAESKSFHWKDCSNAYKGLCQSGLVIDSNVWIEYTKRCFKAGSHPVLEDDTKTIAGENSLDDDDVWIGRIRSWTIQQMPEMSSGNPVRYGYISNTTGTIKLEFTDTRPDKVLCYEDSAETTTQTSISTTSEPTTTTATTTHTTLSNTSVSSATSVEANTSTTPVDTMTERHTGSSGEDGPGGLVAVFVLVPLALVALAAVLVFLYRRKLITRNRKETRSDPDQYQTGACQTSSGNQTVTNASYEKDLPKAQPFGDNQAHDYFTLESSNEYADIHDSGAENNIDADYDTTSGLNNQSQFGGDTVNVYNTFVKPEDTDTYNYTTNDTLCKNKEQQHTDEVYNHIADDEEYSTTAANNAQFDDTYSHVQ